MAVTKRKSISSVRPDRRALNIDPLRVEAEKLSVKHPQLTRIVFTDAKGKPAATYNRVWQRQR